MRGGAAPPFRKNLIGPGRARPFFFAKLARGPLTLRAIAFHQNGRSRGKFLCVGTTSCTLSITSVIGLLIAACFWPGSWRCIKPDNLSMRQERRARLDRGEISHSLSALGHKRTMRTVRPRSALPPKADIGRWISRVPSKISEIFLQGPN